jgi:LacI family transcriptional regulator
MTKSTASASRGAARPAYRTAVATLSDVAARAAVDVSTASRVLRGEAGQRVREETRARIFAAADALGYRANPVARALRMARTNTLGMAVPQLDNPVFAAAIAGAERVAAARGYALLISHLEDAVPAKDAYARLAQLNRVDGLLAATLEEDAPLAEALARAGVPFVALNRVLPGACSVALDNIAAMRVAVDHLVSLGHRRIAHLAGRAGGWNGRLRLAGWRAALRAHGIRPDPQLVEHAGYTASGGAAAMAALLARVRTRPTAVLAATLVSAAGALRTLRHARLAVPGDISVAALHDGPVAELVEPQLTTVALPAEAMGAAGAEALIAMIEGGEISAAATLLPPGGLVRRASTGAVRGR